MSIPTDPGTSILDNNGEAILNQGPTGIAKRLDNLYAMFNAGIGYDNMKLGNDYPWIGNHSFSKGFNAKIPGLISNARLSYSAGVLSLVGENGSAPSATNPVYIRRLDSAGRWETLTFTSSDYCLIQDATSADSYFFDGVNGSPLGTTSGTSWANNMPMFIYVGTAASSVNPCLFLSRKPDLLSASGSSIGYADNPPATPAESNLFAWTTNDVTTSHASASLTCIGFLTFTKDTSDDWTCVGVSPLLSGILSYNYEFISYTMPAGHNGAASGSYFSVSAGTAPIYDSTNTYTYRIKRSGQVSIDATFTNTAAGTAGAGANPLLLSCPLTPAHSTIGHGKFINSSFQIYANPVASTGIYFEYNYNVALGASNLSSTWVSGDLQNNATRSIRVKVNYNL
ncbi:MAG: hypothetical protein AB7O96_01055 [Pseudobdellovibrionaceae bacterium]